MRLSEGHQTVIRSAVLSLDPDAEIFLFGSRVDMNRKGGDIDLLVLSDRLGFEHLWPIRRSILDQIGWQKLDVILDRKRNPAKPIAKVAMLEGVRL